MIWIRSSGQKVVKYLQISQDGQKQPVIFSDGTSPLVTVCESLGLDTDLGGFAPSATHLKGIKSPRPMGIMVHSDKISL